MAASAIAHTPTGRRIRLDDATRNQAESLQRCGCFGLNHCAPAGIAGNNATVASVREGDIGGMCATSSKHFYRRALRRSARTAFNAGKCGAAPVK